MKFGLYGLVLAGILGGGLAWANADRSFDVRVDGTSQTVHSSATDVAGVLKSAHVSVGPHDLVAPGLQAQIKSGADVVVRRGHLVELSVNGSLREVWVNADSVDQALDLLGYDSRSGVSVSRSTRLDTGVTKLAVTSPMRVTVKADGKSHAVVTAGPTVYQAIADAGVYLGPADRLSATGTLTNNQVIVIQRVTFGQQTGTVTVPFSTTKQSDPASYVGTNSVVRPGAVGSNQVTYQLLYLDGHYIGRVPMKTTVLKSPVSQVNKVGTKPAPAFVATASGDAQRIAAGLVAARGWDGSEFSCLVSLWTKESGWRTDASNPSGAYGIPQALPGSKMASVGSDWETSATTQITWGLNYIAGVYGTPCTAWGHSQATNWY